MNSVKGIFVWERAHQALGSQKRTIYNEWPFLDLQLDVCFLDVKKKTFLAYAAADFLGRGDDSTTCTSTSPRCLANEDVNRRCNSTTSLQFHCYFSRQTVCG